MESNITLPLFNKYCKYFNALSRAGIDLEIQTNHGYDCNHATSFAPIIKNATSFELLAKVWEAGMASVKTSQITDFAGFKEVYKNPTAAAVTAEHYKKSESSIKYFAQAAFSKLPQLGVYLLTETPVERKVGDTTYRICCTQGDYYNSEVVYCADQTNAYYNYIDKGHIIVTTSSVNEPESFMFVTDQVTLDMNYVIAAFSVYPEAVLNIMQANAFIPSKDVRMQLIKVERAIP